MRILTYKTIDNPGTAEITQKKSRFIAYAFPARSADVAQSHLSLIKDKHKDASHNCAAWRIGIDIITEKQKDDGEPQGTAGMPILQVLRTEGLTDTIVIVTRYFGGVKLGANGLIRAYTESCAAGIAAAGIVYKDLCRDLAVTVGYNLSGAVKHEIMSRGIILNDILYENNVTFNVSHPYDKEGEALSLYMSLTAGGARVEEIGARYVTRRPSSQ